MYITSPGGYRYPRRLSWDVSARVLELALEWTFDVGEVSVSYAKDVNSSRSYRVTFEVGSLFGPTLRLPQHFLACFSLSEPVCPSR